MIEESQARYSTGAMILHWLIAIGVIANWRIAEAAHSAGSREAGQAIMANHKAIGITILVLTLVRLAWRLVHKPPPLAAHLKTWERVLAKTTHIVFYVLLLGLPLLGWLGQAYFGGGVDMFGLFTMPALPVGDDPAAGKRMFELHHTGGTIIIYLLALHVIGALKHTLLDKDGNLFRMLPFGHPKA